MGQYDTPSTGSTQGSIDSLEKLEQTPEGKRDRWADEIAAAEKEQDKFVTTGRKVVRRYLDERDAINSDKKWFNIFYTNVNIIKASLYANLPGVDVSRTFADQADDIARVASNILQRTVEQDMQEPECDFDQVMRQSVQDRLIPGIGTAWLRLETETEDQPPLEDGTVPMDEEGSPLQRIADQEVRIDYVFWEDFLYSPCRVWAERRWVARRVPMDKDALIERFGDEVAKTIPLDYAPKSSTTGEANQPKNMVMKRACIYEIWDLQKREVIWFCKGVEKLLDVKADPLRLHNRFEPCPKPLFANLTTSNCVPKPDYSMLQDQYAELDETNNRISLLIRACKVVGVYDKGSDGIQRMLTEGTDNTLIPVDNWAMFAEKGGIKGQVDWLPLEQVIAAIAQLQAHREAIKQQIYELSGINDIVRGNTKASETLGAQELKAKFASVRIQELQDEVIRFANEILQIKAEIIVKHFDPLVIAKMANVENMNPDDKPLVVPAMQLLKGNPDEMEWRVNVQADAMAIIDWNRQKQERSEFMTAVATFLQSASTVGQGSPQLIPLMLQMLQFGIAGFRVGKDLEGTFDKYIAEFEKELAAKKNAPPAPDPEMEKMKLEMQQENQRMQNELHLKQQEAAIDLQAKQQEMAMELQQSRQEMMMAQQQFMLEMRQMMQEFALKMQIKREEANLNAQIKVDQSRAEESRENENGAS